MHIRTDPELFTQDGIELILQQHPGAVYMGSWCVKRDGQWENDVTEIFYDPTPDTSKGHSHYFGIYPTNTNVYIVDGASFCEDGIRGALATNGEIVCSRWRKDYHASEDGSAFADGGRNHDLLIGGVNKVVEVVVDGPDFYVNGEKCLKVSTSQLEPNSKMDSIGSAESLESHDDQSSYTLQ
jgi:hypothetical protein